MNLRWLLLTAVLATAPAWPQQAKSPTTEQQARSYILSAFMTGAAPAVVSDDVKVAPSLRGRLGLAQEPDGRALYGALVHFTAGKSFNVRAAKEEDMAMADAHPQAGKPLFALDVSDSTFVMQYDLERDAIVYVADASRPVAVTAPVTAPSSPQAISEPAKPVTEAAVAAPAPVAATPPAAVAATPPAAVAATPPAPVAPVQVVEPREPRFTKPPAPPVAATLPAPVQVTRTEPREPPLKPSGPCTVKPVMSDQDLVNCGARVR